MASLNLFIQTCRASMFWIPTCCAVSQLTRPVITMSWVGLVVFSLSMLILAQARYAQVEGSIQS